MRRCASAAYAARDRATDGPPSQEIETADLGCVHGVVRHAANQSISDSARRQTPPRRELRSAASSTECGLLRGDRATDVIDEHRLAPVVRSRAPLLVFQPLCESEGARIQRRRLETRSELRRTIARSTSEVEHSVGIAGLDRMASKCCRIASCVVRARSARRWRCVAVQGKRLVECRWARSWRKRGEPLLSDLEHVRWNAFCDSLGVARCIFNNESSDACPSTEAAACRTPCPRAESRLDRASTASRTVAGTS